jgi:tetratricopeptide (TPR) repeat protein
MRESGLDPARLAEARAADLAGATRRALTLYLSALAVDVSGSSPQRADVLRWVGNIHLRRGELDDARRHYEWSLEAAGEIGDSLRVAQAVNCQAVVSQQAGDLDRALELYREAAADASRIGAHRLLGMIEQNIAVVMSIRGEWEAALLRYRLSLRAFEEAGDDQATSWVLNNIGAVHREQRQLADAEAAIARARTIADRCGDAWTLAVADLNYAELLLDLGQSRPAEALCERVLSVAQEGNDPLHQAKGLRCRARIFGARGQWKDAVRDLECALGLARACSDAHLTAQVLADLGAARRQGGAPPKDVRRPYEEALERHLAAGSTHVSDAIASQLRALDLLQAPTGPSPLPRNP